MNTNMAGFRCFQKSLHPCALDESNLSIGRDKPIYTQSGQKRPDKFGESLLTKAIAGEHLKRNYQSNTLQQLSFKYLIKEERF